MCVYINVQFQDGGYLLKYLSFAKSVSNFQQWDNFMNHVQGHDGKGHAGKFFIIIEQLMLVNPS